MDIRPLVLSTLITLLSCSAVAAVSVTVKQKGLIFTPSELTVTKGQTVEFVNDDSTAHNILISGDGVSFNGGLQPPGGSIRYTFSKAGSYIVGCGIHPKMKLSITVN